MFSRYQSAFLILAISAGLALPAQPGARPQAASDSTGSSTKTAAKKSSAKSSASSKGKKKAARRHVSPIRVKRVKRAFVASAELKPMARQLLQDRTPPGYAGVEKYAVAHKDEAGSLAWLVIGYAHLVDKQQGAAVEPLKKARLHSDELSDYVDYYLAQAYAGSGDFQHAASTLEGFSTKYPDSVLERDATIAYASALVSTGRDQQAIALLEPRRSPARADLELVLGRAYSAAGQPVRAASQEILAEMQPEEREEVRELLEFKEDTAAGRMTTDYLALTPQSRVSEAIDALRKFEGGIEGVSTIFLVDPDNKLVGAVPLSNLVLAQADEPLSTLAPHPPVSCHAGCGEKEVAELFDKYNLLTLPVVDDRGVMTGVITADDVISLLRSKL